MQFIYDTLAGEGLAGTLIAVLVSSGILAVLYKKTLGKYLDALAEKAAASAFGAMYEDGFNRAITIVRRVNQTYTSELVKGREDGKLTDEEKKHAFDMASNELISSGWGAGVDFIKNNAGTLIEAAVNLLKGEKNVPLASSQPSTDWAPSPARESSSRQEALAPLPELS